MDNEIKKEKTFSIEDIIASSWRLTLDNIGVLLLITFIAIVIYGFVHLITGWLIYPHGFLGRFLAGFINLAVGCILGIGFINVSLKVTNKEQVTVSDLFSKMELFINYFLCSIFQNIAVGIGLILLVIPGLFFLVRFSLGFYVLVDRELGPIESLSRSWELVKGCSWKVFGFLLVCILIDIIGALVVLVGLLVTIPLTVIAFALLYRELERQTFGAQVLKVPEVEVLR